MGIYVPFYGRVYSLLEKIKTIPWFYGQEKVARKTNASIIVFFHQMYLIYFVIDYIEFAGKIEFYIPSWVYYVFFGSLLLLDIIVFQLIGSNNEECKAKDITAMIIFISSFVFFAGHFFLY